MNQRIINMFYLNFTSYFDVLVLEVAMEDEPRYMMVEFEDERVGAKNLE